MIASKTGAISSVLHWYQKKLGSYDQQLWEKTIEERVLRGITNAIPKKVTRVKTDLIDLDLIRGSAFSKSKPKHGRVATTCLAVLRVIFMPLYIKWWSEQINNTVSSLLLLLYVLQVSSMYIYLKTPDATDLTGFLFNTSIDLKELDEIPASEVFFPVILFIILSVIQSHIAASHSLEESSRSRRIRECSPLTGNVINGVVSNGCNSGRKSNQVKRKKRSPEKKCVHRNGVATVSNTETTDKENELPSHVNSHGDDCLENQNMRRNNSRKPSDEESGLEIPEECGPESNAAIRQRTVLSQLTANGQSNDSCNDSPVLSTKSDGSEVIRKDKLKMDDQLTGDEGDRENEDCADFSSLDEISPYSTVNSESWRRYSDIISQRVRSLSKSRRFSGAEEVIRPRSNSHVKHSRSRFSPATRTAADRYASHPDLNISSNDSEASVSPTALNKANTDLDWPMLNSEGTSEDDEEDETHHHSVSISQSRASAYRDDYMSFFAPGFNEVDCRYAEGRSERVSCAIWNQFECQKVDLTVVDISSAVIRKAEKARYSNEYFYLALVIAIILAGIPALFRLQVASNNNGLKRNSLTPYSLEDGIEGSNTSQHQSSGSQNPMVEMLQTFMSNVPVPDPGLILESLVASNCSLVTRFIVIVAVIQRFFMSVFFFFLLCVAEHTYRERFMFAKYFGRLTSARRALGSDLPHFRLNKVRNIKTWLSVRSYLKKHGPQRSVDIIVSGGFILAVCILTFLCVQLLRESDTCSSKLYCWEMVSWNLALGIYILRLMVLGIKTNRKYKSNLSVLITEQINLYLQLEQKPHKKEELTLANHVLKLAADLLKQLETPFKISGFSANHYLYNITKVVVLSAFSAVLTEMLGFKLKLHKIKL